MIYNNVLIVGDEYSGYRELLCFKTVQDMLDAKNKIDKCVKDRFINGDESYDFYKVFDCLDGVDFVSVLHYDTYIIGD